MKVEEVSIKEIKNIVDAILESRGIDFSNYAYSSFSRRIVRYMEINKIRDLGMFTKRISSDAGYADNLVNEITVNVTEMFRDPSFWIVLRDNIIPRLISKPVIKIWHAACSSGEEVYSMAILLQEAGISDSARIVATDINKEVLNVAEHGTYSLKNQETNSKNYAQFQGRNNLSDYFSISDNNIRFNKELVKNVEFHCHNLAQDGAFSTFDLIICRNVLIYFNSTLQEKVLNTFSQSMTEGSYLGIGSKESIRWCKSARYFDEVNFEEKIFRKTAGSNHNERFVN